MCEVLTCAHLSQSFFSPRKELDRGTGSTAIYPFLGCKLDPEWEFVATGMDSINCMSAFHSRAKIELDDISYECASENIRTNNMESRIRLEKAIRGKSILFPLEEENLETKSVITLEICI